MKPLVAAKGQKKGKVVFGGQFDLATKTAMCLIDKGLAGGPGEDRTPDPMVAKRVLMLGSVKFPVGVRFTRHFEDHQAVNNKGLLSALSRACVGLAARDRSDQGRVRR